MFCAGGRHHIFYSKNHFGHLRGSNGNFFCSCIDTSHIGHCFGKCDEGNFALFANLHFSDMTFMFYVALFQHDFTLDIIVMFVLTFIFFVSGVYFVTVYVLTRLYFAVYILVALVFIIVLVVNINL